MPRTVNLTIEPTEKFYRVTEGYADPDDIESNEAEWHDWPDEHQEAADAFIERVDQDATEATPITDHGDGELSISCPTCGWDCTTTARESREEMAKSDLRSRLDAHLPCNDMETPSWDLISLPDDADLVGKMATYLTGMEPDEPTNLLRAKLRLIDADLYLRVQYAARTELQNT